MGDQDKLEKDFETLTALLEDIKKELDAESEDYKDRIRELYQQCILELELLRKSGKKDTDRDTTCR
jgi:prefoldin subunit 5